MKAYLAWFRQLRQLRLMVDDEEGGGKQEMIYDVTSGEEKGGSIETIEREETDGKDREAEGGEAGDRGEERAEGIRPYSRGEVPGGALGLDGKTETRGVCRELGVAWSLLNQWQERPMEGMLLALQPRVSVEKGVALSPRLAVLLERRSKAGTIKGWERRLTRLQRSPLKPGELQEIGV